MKKKSINIEGVHVSSSELLTSFMRDVFAAGDKYGVSINKFDITDIVEEKKAVPTGDLFTPYEYQWVDAKDDKPVADAPKKKKKKPKCLVRVKDWSTGAIIKAIKDTGSHTGAARRLGLASSGPIVAKIIEDREYVKNPVYVTGELNRAREAYGLEPLDISDRKPSVNVQPCDEAIRFAVCRADRIDDVFAYFRTRDMKVDPIKVRAIALEYGLPTHV